MFANNLVLIGQSHMDRKEESKSEISEFCRNLSLVEEWS